MASALADSGNRRFGGGARTRPPDTARVSGRRFRSPRPGRSLGAGHSHAHALHRRSPRRRSAASRRPCTAPVTGGRVAATPHRVGGAPRRANHRSRATHPRPHRSAFAGPSPLGAAGRGQAHGAGRTRAGNLTRKDGRGRTQRLDRRRRGSRAPRFGLDIARWRWRPLGHFARSAAPRRNDSAFTVLHGRTVSRLAPADATRSTRRVREAGPRLQRDPLAGIAGGAGCGSGGTRPGDGSPRPGEARLGEGRRYRRHGS
jgi:hypothetical protein